MNKILCPELCPTCPLRNMVPDEPRYLEEVGERAIPKTGWTPDGRSMVSLDFEHGRVVGPRLAEVALMSEGADSGPAFWVKGEVWESGGVQRAFEDCHKPTHIRAGILKLGKEAVCAAVLKFAEKS